MSLQMTSKIEKLKYLSDKNFHSLDEITKLLIAIVEDLDKEIKDLRDCIHTPNETTVKAIEEVEEMIKKPKKKRKWL